MNKNEKAKFRKVIKPIVDYGKNVAGGAKIVGSVIAAPFKWAGKQVEKEMKMNKSKDDRYRAEGAVLNKSYSGLPSNVKYRK